MNAFWVCGCQQELRRQPLSSVPAPNAVSTVLPRELFLDAHGRKAIKKAAVQVNVLTGCFYKEQH